MEWTEGAPCNCQTLRHHVKVAFGPNSAALAELDRLVGEVERLRGVVELLREARAWWPRDPRSPDVPKMNPAAPFLEAIDAALAALEAGE